VRDLIPQDSHSAEDLDDWLTTIGTGAVRCLRVSPVTFLALRRKLCSVIASF